MALSFNEFNSFYEELRQIVKEEVQAELIQEGFFDGAKGIFGGGASHSPVAKTSAQSKLNAAKQDDKTKAEFRELVNKNPGIKITYDQFLKMRSKMKDEEMKAAKQQVSNFDRLSQAEKARSDRSKNASDRTADLQLQK